MDFNAALAAVVSFGLAPLKTEGEPAHSAADRIGALYGTLIQTMQQAKQLGVKGRYELSAPVLSNTYDIPSMSRTAVGQSWSALDPGQQAGIIDAFTRMMVANYANQFDGFSGERFEIVQTIDRAPADKLVKTHLIQANGKVVALDYLMRNTGGEWKVVDVYLDGTISELANRRAEFSAILKAGGPTALIDFSVDRATSCLPAPDRPRGPSRLFGDNRGRADDHPRLRQLLPNLGLRVSPR